jgi:RNA polymerase primary sigma factor
MALAQRPHQSLSPDAEHELVLVAIGGDSAARDELVEAFLPLIGSVARRYRNSSGVDHRELMQEGVVGLLRALERYNRELGGPFWPYATWWVRQAMQRLVAELTRPVVLSDRALRQLARVKDAQREHVQAQGMEPSSTELATRAGLTRKQVETLSAVDRAPRRFEEPVGRDEETIGTFGDLFEDPLAQNEYERVEEQEEILELHDLTADLAERERTVLWARFGVNGPEQTLRQIAGSLGLSAERVRQIEERALGKLREAAMVG